MADNTNGNSSSSNLPTVTNVEIFSSLEKKDLGSSVKYMGPSQEKSWLTNFTRKHLPANRLQANEDDLTNKFTSTGTAGKWQKKRRKGAKMKVARSIHSKTKIEKGESKTEVTSTQKYSTYLPLQDLWTSYIEDLMQLKKSEPSASVLPTLAQKMMKADLHGCQLTVMRSKCPSYIGVQGIVIQETRNMFTLVCPGDKVKRIPKANSVFTTKVHETVFTIYGNQFLVRPGERAAKKFKAKPSIDL